MSKKNKKRTPVMPGFAVKTEFNPDYTHVKRDLRRIGLLAGIFVAILIVLSLFQDQLMALFIK